MDWLNKLKTLSNDQEVALKTVTAESVTDLWRKFLIEADSIFKSSSTNATDSWNLHLVHRDAAEACCRDGDTARARTELMMALEALQGLTIMQPELI